MFNLTTEQKQNFWRRVGTRSNDECWEWLSGTFGKEGYGAFWVPPNTLGSHRIAWVLANGQDIPRGMSVLHSCDNRKCCNPDHLRVGTHKSNADDRILRGRNYSLISPEQAQIVVKRLLAGEIGADIARSMSINDQVVYSIADGRAWRRFLPVGVLRIGRHRKVSKPTPFCACGQMRQLTAFKCGHKCQSGLSEVIDEMERGRRLWLDKVGAMNKTYKRQLTSTRPTLTATLLTSL